MNGIFQANDIRTLVIVMIVVIFTMVMVAVILPWLRKRGIDVDGIISQTKEGLDTVNTTLNIVRPFMEDGQVVNAFDEIIKAANTAAGHAEQLNRIGKLEKGEREAAAREYISNALSYIGIEETPEVKRLADGALMAAVNGLGHASDKARLNPALDP